MNKTSLLLLSYGPRDHDKVLKVHRHLSERGVATFIDLYNRRAGQNWAYSLDTALRKANGVVVLVGGQIGNRQWSEIGFALDRQASEPGFQVVLVLLDGADLSRSFLLLNSWVDLRGSRIDDPEALDDLVHAFMAPSTDVASHVELNPFRGLQFFDESHAPFFFGREAVVEELFDRVTRQCEKFVAVVGASGSGKSSVVRAGLIPRLRRRRPPHETWDVAVLTPGENPWFRLADALGPVRFLDKNGVDLDIEIDKLAEALQSGDSGLGSLLERILQPQGPMHRLLLVIDQFEELFTLAPESERETFIDRLIECRSTPGLVLVIILRADFYGHALQAHHALSELLSSQQVTLGRLTIEQLSRAISEPARLAKLGFDPGLPERLLRDVKNEPGGLPLLQHALFQLYEHGKRHAKLTTQAYTEIGGIRGAIANSAEQAFQRLAAQGLGLAVRRIFTQLVRMARADEGVEDTRRRVATTDLPPETRVIVDEFSGQEFRLLVKNSERMPTRRSGTEVSIAEQETVEVAHEALIREWDRLGAWLNEDRSFYLWRQHLDERIAEYSRRGGHRDYLLQGAALREAEAKLVSHCPKPLSVAQQTFINDSLLERTRAEGETQRIEAERHLLEDKMLIQLDRIAHFTRASTMRALAAGIANELNPPIATIVTHAETCQRLISNNDFPQADIAAALDHIGSQALRAGEIVRRLGTFVKHRSEPQREPVAANGLLEDAVILAKTDLRHHNIRMVMELSPQAPWVRADTVHIQWVILSLLHNSIDAMVDVPVAQREIVLRTQLNSGGNVEFMVADRGIGIDADTMAMLFHQLFTTKPGGTGLGLAISRSTVHAHGGQMWCDANPNGGTRFFFTLKAVPAQLETRRPPRSAPQADG